MNKYQRLLKFHRRSVGWFSWIPFSVLLQNSIQLVTLVVYWVTAPPFAPRLLASSLKMIPGCHIIPEDSRNKHFTVLFHISYQGVTIWHWINYVPSVKLCYFDSQFWEISVFFLSFLVSMINSVQKHTFIRVWKKKSSNFTNFSLTPLFAYWLGGDLVMSTCADLTRSP